MALHYNLRLFFLLHSLLTPLHFAQPEISPSPDPDSSLQSEFVSSPSLSPTSAPTSSADPNPGPSPSLGPTPDQSPYSGPAQGPSPSSGPTPSPSPYSESAQGPSPYSRPEPSTSPSSGPAPNPSSDDLDIYDDYNKDDPPPIPTPSIEGPAPAPSIDIDSKVQKICEATDHPTLCLTTVAPLLNGKTDISSVVDVAMTAGEKLSRYGLLLAQKLSAEPGTSPELASVLDNCKNSYSTAVDNYEQTMDAFPENDIDTVRIKLSAIITCLGDCEDALKKQGPDDTTFSAIAPRLRNMTSNCLALVSLL